MHLTPLPARASPSRGTHRPRPGGSAASRRPRGRSRRPPSARPRRAARGASVSVRATTPGCSVVSASRGSSVTPTPAATSACAALVSSASKATLRLEAGLAADGLGDHAAAARGGGRHPGLPFEVAEREPAALGQRVTGGQEHLVGVVDQVHQLELGGQHVRHGGVVVDQRQVGVAGSQPARGLLGLGLVHRQLHARVALAEGGHRARRERGAAALEARSAAAARRAGRQGPPARPRRPRCGRGSRPRGPPAGGPPRSGGLRARRAPRAGCRSRARARPRAGRRPTA